MAKNELLEKLITDAEKDLELIALRTEFWQAEEAVGKSNKQEIMNQMRNQVAQAILARKWLEFLQSKKMSK